MNSTGALKFFVCALLLGVLAYNMVKIDIPSRENSLLDLVEGAPAIFGTFELEDSEAQQLIDLIKLESERSGGINELWPDASSDSNVILIYIKKWPNMQYFDRIEGLEKLSVLAREYPDTKSRAIAVVGADGPRPAVVVIYKSEETTDVVIKCIAKDFVGLFREIPDNDGEQLHTCFE